MSVDDAKIGIVGGAGPYAGLDLAQKILEQTIAEKDQDYLPTLLISTPDKIEDRTRFLLGEITSNPAHSIFRNLCDLNTLGASVVGIPCNTAHAPAIKDVFLEKWNLVGTGTCGSRGRRRGSRRGERDRRRRGQP